MAIFTERHRPVPLKSELVKTLKPDLSLKSVAIPIDEDAHGRASDDT